MLRSSVSRLVPVRGAVGHVARRRALPGGAANFRQPTRARSGRGRPCLRAAELCPAALRLTGVPECRCDAGDRAQERRAHAVLLRLARLRIAVAARGARPGSRSSGRRTDFAGRSSAARPDAGRAAAASRRSRARLRPPARAPRRSRRTGGRVPPPPGRAAGSRARSPGSTWRASSRGSRSASGRRRTSGTAGEDPRTGADCSAVPQPYQAGSRQRFCVQAKTHGIARSERRSSSPPGRRDGRDPSASSDSSSTGVNERKKAGNAGSVQTSER